MDSRRGLWRHIRAFIANGGGVLLTTHYLEEADALADRIVVLNHGIVAAKERHRRSSNALATQDPLPHTADDT